MLTPEEFIEIMKKISLWSYDTELTVDENEDTYCPSEEVCSLDNIEEILQKPRSARFQRFLNTIHFNRGCKSKPHYIFIPF